MKLDSGDEVTAIAKVMDDEGEENSSDNTSTAAQTELF